MRYKRQKSEQRKGAAVVEFAVVSLILFMFLFGILEYARFLFIYHITNNAARDAARFAAVRTGGGTLAGEPAVVTDAHIDTLVRTGIFNSQQYGTGMGGLEHNIQGMTVNVFAVDPNLFAPATITSAYAPANRRPWTSAAFGDKIAVEVTGTYQPILPNLLGMNSAVPFTVVIVCNSEAN
jgi:hypothetical protein